MPKKRPDVYDLEDFTVDEIEKHLAERKARKVQEDLKAREEAAGELARIGQQIHSLLRQAEELSKKSEVPFELNLTGERRDPTYYPSNEQWYSTGWMGSSSNC